MVIDITRVLKGNKEILSLTFLGCIIVFAALILLKITGFYSVCANTQQVIEQTIANFDAPRLDVELKKDREIVDSLSANNVFNAVPVSITAISQNPITEIRAIVGSSVLINGEWHKAGDSIGNAKIVAVEPTQITVEFEGRQTTYRTVDASIPVTQQAPARGTTSSPLATSSTRGTSNTGISATGATIVAVPEGVRIESLTSGRATRFGLQQGDIVLSINGQKITSADSFNQVIDGIAQGAEVSIQVRRNGVETTVQRSALNRGGGATGFGGGTGGFGGRG
jgi:type II secretory pathway component PulC